MDKRIEDEIFTSALEAMNINRTKKHYKKCNNSHRCSMCGEVFEKGKSLKMKFVHGFDTPYLFVCNECFEELPNE